MWANRVSSQFISLRRRCLHWGWVLSCLELERGLQLNFDSRRCGRRVLKVLVRLFIMSVLWLTVVTAPQPAHAATAQPERSPLTLDILKDRLKSPSQSDGIRMLDLRHFVIDLRPENQDFRDEFYRLLRSQLQQSETTPWGIDLSYSLIQGELNTSQLGKRSPLYGQETAASLTEAEQAQLQRDRRRLSQLSQLSRSLLIQSRSDPPQITLLQGPLKLTQTRFEGFANLTNTFFFNRIEAKGATFTQGLDASEARFSRPISLAGSTFQQQAQFRNAIFFEQANFNQAQFQGDVNFQSAEFRNTANFNQVSFQNVANFTRVQWQGNADFAQTRWQDEALFSKGKFAESFFLTEATFEQLVTFREAQFNQPANLRSASILDQADFGDAEFAEGAYLNVSGLQFNSEEAKILGDPGRVGQALSVPTLQGNETLLRNLVRNFRLLEQIPDANQLEYTTEKLRLRQLRQELLSTNLNIASAEQLRRAGFSPEQAQAILNQRSEQFFRSLTDLLKLDGIDLATYVKVRDRVIAQNPQSWAGWILDALHWMGLSLLILLSRYGTSFWLIFGVGMVAIAFFSVVFWLVDRYRRISPEPLRPKLEEALWMMGSCGFLTLGGFIATFRSSDRPWLTIACLTIIIVPIPALLILLIYWQKPGPNPMKVSYFVEDGAVRQLRLLIGRLPIMPRYAFFRDRHMPLLWDRRWNWLNYLDFSLNNLLKFGFNDIRLRDEKMPGLITGLAWYQWGLGILYIALLLWTLSRTIPGLNLLIYFK